MLTNFLWIFQSQTQILELHASMPLLLVGRTLIVNQTLMSSLWCFIAVWIGSKKILSLEKIKVLLCNYLWFGSENTAITIVTWDGCTMPKRVGGFHLTPPDDAMRALMSKWITQAISHSQLNMQVLLRYHITQLQHSCYGSWGMSSLWLFYLN